jgi:hypothetical protein
MRKGFLIFEELRKYFPIYEEVCISIYMRKILFFIFYQCNLPAPQAKTVADEGRIGARRRAGNAMRTQETLR